MLRTIMPADAEQPCTNHRPPCGDQTGLLASMVNKFEHKAFAAAVLMLLGVYFELQVVLDRGSGPHIVTHVTAPYICLWIYGRLEANTDLCDFWL